MNYEQRTTNYSKKQKALLRKRILVLRRSQSSQEIERKSDEIKRKLFAFSIFCKAQTVLFYLAMRDEVQTKEMIKEALRLGKRIAVPLVEWQKKEILPSELKDYNKELEVGMQGILQPKKNFYHPLPLDDIDLVIVPGLIFDREGNRLGFGAGFYDRFLKKVSLGAKSAALAFELQLVDNIPSQSYDIAVDYIITEREIIDTKIVNRGW